MTLKPNGGRGDDSEGREIVNGVGGGGSSV